MSSPTSEPPCGAADPNAGADLASERNHTRGPRRAALGTACAFVTCLACVVLVGSIVVAIGNPDGVTGIDQRVLDWMVRHRSDGVTHLMRIVTTLGGTLFIAPLTTLLAITLLVVRRRALAVYLVTVVVGASLLSSFGKALVGRPRPPIDVRIATVAGSAFPSGHSTQAAATYVAIGIIVFVLVANPWVRAVAWVLLATVIAAVGFSRLYLGVHWLTDVLAGLLLGSGWALGVAIAFGVIGPSDRNRSPAGELGLAARTR